MNYTHRKIYRIFFWSGLFKIAFCLKTWSEMLDTLRFMKNWNIIDYRRLIVGFIEPTRDFVIGVLFVQNQRSSTVEVCTQQMRERREEKRWKENQLLGFCTKFTFLITPHKAQWNCDSTADLFIFIFIMSIDLSICMWINFSLFPSELLIRPHCCDPIWAIPAKRTCLQLIMKFSLNPLLIASHHDF